MRIVNRALIAFFVLSIILTSASCGSSSFTTNAGASDTNIALAFAKEFTIPSDFTTYNDEAGLYNISYPSNWEMNLAILDEAKKQLADYIHDIKKGLPVDKVQYLFMAGLPNGSGYHPNVTIVTEPKPASAKSLKAVIAAEMRGMKAVTKNYEEISHTLVNVGKDEACIIEYKAQYPQIGAFHNIILVTFQGGTIWSVGCTLMTSLANYEEYRDDFTNIMRSFQIPD